MEYGIISSHEREGVDRVLNAAALTYVAAAVSSLLTLLYYLWRAGLLGGRRDRLSASRPAAFNNLGCNLPHGLESMARAPQEQPQEIIVPGNRHRLDEKRLAILCQQANGAVPYFGVLPGVHAKAVHQCHNLVFGHARRNVEEIVGSANHDHRNRLPLIRRRRFPVNDRIADEIEFQASRRAARAQSV